MSGIGGVFTLDGSPVDERLLGTLSDRLRPRGPDGTSFLALGRAGFVHTHFWTTPEDMGEEQPLSAGHLSMVADARIDNRKELLSDLGGFFLEKVPTDAELVLAAFRLWGKDCPRHLVGDFAFAVYDQDAGILFLARDTVGIRPLHYALMGKVFVFASDVGSVLGTGLVPPVANLPFIADLLAGRYGRWFEETAFSHVRRIAPAHYVTVSREGTSTARYWTFGEGPCPECGTDEEYLALFGRIFWEAVRCRLRSSGPAGMTVSGGLDSSSLVCMTDRMIRNGEVSPLTVRLYSSVYEHCPGADEKEYLEEVLRACPSFPATLLVSDDLWGMKEFASDHDFPLEDPETDVARSLLLSYLRTMKKDGCRVCISGHGGDQVMNTDTYYFSDVLNDLDLKRVVRELPYFFSYRESFHRFIFSALIAPHLPELVKKRISSLVSDPTAGGVLTELCLCGAPSVENPPPPGNLAEISQEKIFHAVTNGINSAYRAELDSYASYIGIEWRFPFYDRRLIDFMLHMPAGLTFREGFTRNQVRETMKGVLPEKIRLRVSKCHGGEAQDRGLKIEQRERAELLMQDSIAVRLGLVHRDRLVEAWESYLEDGGYPARPLVRFFCAEAWLRWYEKTYHTTLSYE